MGGVEGHEHQNGPTPLAPLQGGGDKIERYIFKYWPIFSHNYISMPYYFILPSSLTLLAHFYFQIFIHTLHISSYTNFINHTPHLI